MSSLPVSGARATPEEPTREHVPHVGRFAASDSAVRLFAIPTGLGSGHPGSSFFVRLRSTGVGGTAAWEVHLKPGQPDAHADGPTLTVSRLSGKRLTDGCNDRLRVRPPQAAAAFMNVRCARIGWSRKRAPGPLRWGTGHQDHPRQVPSGVVCRPGVDQEVQAAPQSSVAWLHLVIGLGMIALGVLLAKRDRDKRGQHDGR